MNGKMAKKIRKEIYNSKVVGPHPGSDKAINKTSGQITALGKRRNYQLLKKIIVKIQREC